MTSFLIQHFDTLKGSVLTTAGFSTITPSECKAISYQILKKTNQQVSETTLKRVYGFAYSKFNPSLFTLDAMAKFCSYKSWADFCENTGNDSRDSQVRDVSWDNIKHNADKITNFTLQVLKNRSGIPYNQTIGRRFINDHLDTFLKSDCTATLLLAPAGYGKTIALCHWVEEKLSRNAAGVNNDIILFFSSNALINVFISGKGINEWILSLLGYGVEEGFSTLLDVKRKHDGCFYLVIDGLDEHMFKNEQFQMLLSQVLDVFSFYQFSESFKLVLTMRSATWVNHRLELEESGSKWFHGFKMENCPDINVPLFSVEEIEELCTKINPAVQSFVDIEVAESFNHPLYFQFYYKQNKDNFSLNNIDHICIYELISTFILNKIYLGPHSAEKILLVKAIIDGMDFARQKYAVDKLKLNDLIKQNAVAYNELAGIGFIREMNRSSDLQYDTVIEFSNSNFLEYSIARNLLSKNNNLFNSQLIKTINQSFFNERKVQILKWCIIYAIKTGQHESFEVLPETHLAAKEKSELLLYLGDLFEKEYSILNKNPEMLRYFKRDCNDGLFEYFFGLEFINTDYKKALHTLLRFELSNKKKILVYTSLAAIAIIQLDITELEEYLSNLKSFSPDELQALVINPLSCLETIYYYLKYGIVKKEAFIDLTKFYFNPPTGDNASKDSSTNDILYLLAVYTLSICKNPVRTTRFINAVGKVYKKEPGSSPGFYMLLKLMVCEADILHNKTVEGIRIYNEIVESYTKESHSYTPLMNASYYLLKVKMALYDDKKSDLPETIKILNNLTEQYDFKLIKINCLAFILTNKCLLDGNAAYYKNAQYNFTEIVHESGFREESFINNDMIME